MRRLGQHPQFILISQYVDVIVVESRELGRDGRMFRDGGAGTTG
jgi:hypothetical protein